MNKWFLALIAIYVMGDPNLAYLEAFGEMKNLVVAGVLSWFLTPWVVSNIDG